MSRPAQTNLTRFAGHGAFALGGVEGPSLNPGARVV
jgi:hypothetical protein